VGIVAGRSGDGWRVDIGAAHFALLDALAFEGATKRNRPNLKVKIIQFNCFIRNKQGKGGLSRLRPSLAGP